MGFRYRHPADARPPGSFTGGDLRWRAVLRRLPGQVVLLAWSVGWVWQAWRAQWRDDTNPWR